MDDFNRRLDEVTIEMAAEARGRFYPAWEALDGDDERQLRRVYNLGFQQGVRDSLTNFAEPGSAKLLVESWERHRELRLDVFLLRLQNEESPPA